MVVPLIILVAIPVFLGIVVVSPFDQPEEPKNEVIPEEPNDNILYFVLTLIWIVVLIRILLQLKKGTFNATQKY
jgi:NADH:ubiquinone oxidoreductase subunit 5 (subunit L)/multisubunit Na+/H+ antiporter MnhA subunit